MSAAVKRFVVSTFALVLFALLPSTSSALCKAEVLVIDAWTGYGEGEHMIMTPASWHYETYFFDCPFTGPLRPAGDWCDAHPGSPQCSDYNRDFCDRNPGSPRCQKETTCPAGEVKGPDGKCGCPAGEVPGPDGKCTKDPGCGDTESNTLGALATKAADKTCTGTTHNEPSSWGPKVYAGPYYLPETCQGSNRLEAFWNREVENFEMTNGAILNIPAAGIGLFVPELIAEAQGARFAMLGRATAAGGMRAVGHVFFAFSAGVALGSAVDATKHVIQCELPVADPGGP